MFQNYFSKPQPAPPIKADGPYKAEGTNMLYNLLFCDMPSLYQPRPGASPVPWQQTVLASSPDPAAVRALAGDASEESRVRVLAFNWLRANNHSVPKGELLGTIIEVPFEKGLDVLAAYPDGRVRYINQTGKSSIFEAAPPNIKAKADQLLEISRAIIQRIGPWDRPRLAPPSLGKVRMTFLVSDGLYFGEGPFEHMQRDQMAGPLLHAAGQLLNAVVDASIAK